MIRIIVRGQSASCVKDMYEHITTGLVGKKIYFSFSEEWDGYAKTAVFTGSDVTKDVLIDGDSCTIPPECLAQADGTLVCGIYGAKDGEVTPTIYCTIDRIKRGADPSGDPSVDPALPVWAQLRQQIGDLEQLDTEAKDSLVAAINEAFAKGADIADDAIDPDRHAEYFVITEDGVVALKPEYRGASTRTAYPYSVSDMGAGAAGSKNAELPQYLVIPEIVDGKAVCSLAAAIFCANLAVESVALPVTISEIPERCFDGANELKNVDNTENIKTIGKCAFQSTSIMRLRCPNLESLEDISTFQYSGRLVYIDIGKVSVLPDKTFNSCINLNLIKSANKIATVGASCFRFTPNLTHAGFIPNLTSIGDVAFFASGVEYDWSGLTDCAFGADATPLQYNPTDFWSACAYTPCENRLPTFLAQNDKRWKNREIGTSGSAYGSGGCLMMCTMHAYCGLHNLSLSSVEEFEGIINGINPDLINTFTQDTDDLKAFCDGLGLTVERYATYDQTVLQTLYDAFAAGKYAIFALVGKTTNVGHAVLGYGINDNGEILLADSESYYKDDDSKPASYSLPYCKLTAPNFNDRYILNILSL